MKSIYGVAGNVTPGELGPLEARLAAAGSATRLLRSPGLEIVLAARSPIELETWHRGDEGRHAICVGRPLHPSRSGPDAVLAEALDGIAHGDRHGRSDSWLGEFNLIVTDGHVLEIESDCLGLRPLFLSERAGRTVFGSDVLPLAEAGLVESSVDPQALAAWLLLEHPLDGRTLFENVRRMPPGRARIELSTGSMRLEPVDWEDDDREIRRSELARRLGAAVDDLLTRVVREEPRIGAFLSGGYDSRFVACRLAALGHVPDEAILVSAGTGDAGPGREVAARLDLPLRVIPVEGSLYDAFGDPWFFAPHGFPQRRFYTSIALGDVGAPPPMVDGLLGDDGVRGWVYERVVSQRSAGTGDLSAGLLEAHLSLRPEVLFREAAADRLRGLLLDQIRGFRPGLASETRRAWLWVLLHRTRDFHAKNHLQVLDRTETYHPFVHPELIRLRLTHRADQFDDELYGLLLAANCPELEGIPHSDSLPRTDVAHARFSRVFQRRVPALLRMVATDSGRAQLDASRIAPRVAAYGVGRRTQKSVVRSLDRIRVLRDRVREIGSELPWEDLWSRPT